MKNYSLYAYKNGENCNPTEAVNRSANWIVGSFTHPEDLTFGDVSGIDNRTVNSGLPVMSALIESAYNMAEMFGYNGDIGLYIVDSDNGDYIAFAAHDAGEWVEPCKHCEGWCAIDPDHSCDGFQAEEDEKKCPECGAVMKYAVLPDSVGNGMHEGHECPDCGYSE